RRVGARAGGAVSRGEVEARRSLRATAAERPRGAPFTGARQRSVRRLVGHEIVRRQTQNPTATTLPGTCPSPYGRSATVLVSPAQPCPRPTAHAAPRSGGPTGARDRARGRAATAARSRP